MRLINVSLCYKMYDKYICGKEIIILGTLLNIQDPDEMLQCSIYN